MNKFVFVLALTLGTQAFGSSKLLVCPEGTDTVAMCTSAPQSGEGDVASNMLEQITVCGTEDGAFWLARAKGESSERIPVDKIERRVGAVAFIIRNGTEGLIFKLVVPVAMNPKYKEFRSTFTVGIPANPEMSASTYACKK